MEALVKVGAMFGAFVLLFLLSVYIIEQVKVHRAKKEITKRLFEIMGRNGEIILTLMVITAAISVAVIVAGAVWPEHGLFWLQDWSVKP